MAKWTSTLKVISTERSMAKNTEKIITTKNNPMTRTVSQSKKTKLKQIRIHKSHHMQIKRTN